MDSPWRSPFNLLSEKLDIFSQWCRERERERERETERRRPCLPIRASPRWLYRDSMIDAAAKTRTLLSLQLPFVFWWIHSETNRHHVLWPNTAYCRLEYYTQPQSPILLGPVLGSDDALQRHQTAFNALIQIELDIIACSYCYYIYIVVDYAKH